jgi:hypothetical protein
MKTLRLLVALLLAGGSVLAEDASPLSYDFIRTWQSKEKPLYKVLITNTSKETLSLGAERKQYARGVTWKPTDTYRNPMTLKGTTTTFPAFYAKIVDGDGKEVVLGAKHIKEAIQNSTGAEDSFCTLAPGESVICAYPLFPNKPATATFHFLQRRGGKVSETQLSVRREAQPVPAWIRATKYPAPEADTSRIQIYDVPPTAITEWPPAETRLKDRVYNMKAWSAQNGLAEDEIDFALFDWRTRLFLISTSEANHHRLKELQFETH